jgi:hypothetical protein
MLVAAGTCTGTGAIAFAGMASGAGTNVASEVKSGSLTDPEEGAGDADGDVDGDCVVTTGDVDGDCVVPTGIDVFRTTDIFNGTGPVAGANPTTTDSGVGAGVGIDVGAITGD